jgi:hypothetical protein
MASLSNEPLIKHFRAIKIGDSLHAVEIPAVNYEGVLLILGYDPAEYPEDVFKKTKLLDLVRDAPRNGSNRPLGTGDAMNWMKSMAKSRWVQNGQPWTLGKDGKAVSLQHRALAFLTLVQLWMKGKLPEFADQKMANSKHAPTIPITLLFGVENKKHAADTVDIGRTRSLGDVLFRNRPFGTRGRTPKELASLTKQLSHAARLVWLRADGKSVRQGPKFDSMEGVAFVQDKHPDLIESMQFVDSVNDNSSGGIVAMLTLGYAGACLYMMSISSTVYGEDLDWENKHQAEEFWTTFARSDGHKKGSPVLALRDFLTRQRDDGNGNRDMRVNAVAKAWIAFLAGKEIGWADLKTKKNEIVHFGGIDISKEERDQYENPTPPAEEQAGDDQPAEPAKKKPAKKAPKKKPAKSKPAPVDDPPADDEDTNDGNSDDGDGDSGEE